MVTVKTIFYIFLPIALVLIILMKKDRFEFKGNFWINQKWQCYDILQVVICFSVFQIASLTMGKYELVKFYNLYIFGNIFCIVALGVILFGLIYFKYHANYSSLGLSSDRLLSNIAIGLTTFFIYTLIIIVISFLLNREIIFYNRAELFIKMKLNELPLLDSMVYVVGIIAVAPFVEECLFRGLMFSPFARKIGELGSICLTSILWSILHFQTKSLISLFLIGILLCYLYKRFKSLIPGIVMHSMLNLSNLIIFIFWIMNERGM